MTIQPASVWLPTLIVFVASLPHPASAQGAACVVASSVKVRAEPRTDAEMIGSLPILLRVYQNDERDGWVQVSLIGDALPTWFAPSLHGGGWVRAEFLAPECPTFKEAMEQAAKATDPPVRLSFLERAAALAPSRPALIEAMQALARALEQAKDESAAKVRRELEVLLDPASQTKAKRERGLALAVLKPTRSAWSWSASGAPSSRWRPDVTTRSSWHLRCPEARSPVSPRTSTAMENPSW